MVKTKWRWFSSRRRTSSPAQIETLSDELKKVSDQAEEAKSGLAWRSRAEIEKLKREKEQMLAKKANAEARIQIQETLDGLSTDADVKALDNVREHISKLQAEADIGSEIQGDSARCEAPAHQGEGRELQRAQPARGDEEADGRAQVRPRPKASRRRSSSTLGRLEALCWNGEGTVELPDRSFEAEDAFVEALAEAEDPEALTEAIEAAMRERRPRLAGRLVGLLEEWVEIEPDSDLGKARQATRLLLVAENPEEQTWADVEAAWSRIRSRRIRRIKRRMRANLSGDKARFGRLGNRRR